MAFTREFIRNAAKESGVEIPKELEDALVQEHLSARDAFAEGKVKTALEENKPEPAQKVKDTQEYKDLKKAFDNYKAEQEGKETRAAKEKAVMEYLKGKNVQDANLKLAMRSLSAEIDAVELVDGKLKDTKAFDDLLSGDLAGLVTTTMEKPAPSPANPPTNTGKAMSREEIYKKDDKGRYVLSTAERQKAIAENHEQFGI